MNQLTQIIEIAKLAMAELKAEKQLFTDLAECTKTSVDAFQTAGFSREEAIGFATAILSKK